MRYLMMLAAAASLAACHNRSGDEVGAAPNQGRADTTAVAQDSTKGTPTDSTMGQRPGAADTTAVQSDTSSMSTPTTDSTTSTGNQPTDTTSQSTGGYSDSTSMGNDSTMSMPADSAKQ
jgi:type II secretory pathway pseudopilin PulG